MAEKLASLRKKGGNVVEGSYTMKTTANNPQSITLPFAPKFFVGYIEVSGIYENPVYDEDKGYNYTMYKGGTVGVLANDITISGKTVCFSSVADAFAGHDLKYIIGK